VEIRISENRIKTDLRKMGAMIGDQVEIGCNAVLNPGSVIGAGSRIYPLTTVRGYVPAHSILKQNGEIVTIKA
jgi:acetyltransferase-like isoleucine patch superfamily enzyme